MRRTRLLVPIVCVSVALVAAACGGDDGDDDGATTTTVATDAGGTDESTTTTVAGDPGATTTTAAGGEDDTATTSAAGEEVDGAVGAGDASVAAPDLTGAEICDRLPAGPVATALGISDITAEPGTTATPQCSYRFVGADGTDTDATVAALRTEGDLQGRFGDDAFTYVADLNKAAAQGSVTETPLDVGNHSVLLTGSRLHMAIVQLGGRIVTVLLSSDEGDAAAASALARAAAGTLAP